MKDSFLFEIEEAQFTGMHRRWTDFFELLKFGRGHTQQSAPGQRRGPNSLNPDVTLPHASAQELSVKTLWVPWSRLPVKSQRATR